MRSGLPVIKGLLFSPFRAWRARWTALRIAWRWPELRVTGPCHWDVDDLSGLDLEGRIQIGPFTEIVVSTRSPYSRIPGHLKIGDRTVIGSGSNLRAAGGAIRIGSDCLIAQQVSLIASGHGLRAGAIYHELPWDETRTGITIEDNVWLGCGVVVLPGCTIGRGAVVGAGSVVTKDIPAASIWTGVPARPLRAIA
jgi:acetyltransferase-like isoleucine patch superfamily enzyme